MFQVTFSRAAFVGAALAVWFGLLHFRSPYEKALVFTTVCFVLVFAYDSYGIAWYLNAIAAGVDAGQRVHDFRHSVAAGVIPAHALFWLSMLWARLEAGARRDCVPHDDAAVAVATPPS